VNNTCEQNVDVQRNTIEDIIQSAKLVHALYSVEKLQCIFRAFGNEILSGVTELRTTNKTNPELNFRTIWNVDNNAPSLYDRAVKEGLLSPKNTNIDNIFADMVAAFPTSVRKNAIDFDAQYGVVKLWHYTSVVHPSQLSLLKYAPPSLLSLVDVFVKLDLLQISIFGVDYQNESINIYFKLHSSYHATHQFVEDVLRELKYEVPSASILNFCATSHSLAVTLSWNTTKPPRICFYKRVPTLEQVKLELGECALYEFTKNAPTLKLDPWLIISQSLGPKLSSANSLEISRVPLIILEFVFSLSYSVT